MMWADLEAKGYSTTRYEGQDLEICVLEISECPFLYQMRDIFIGYMEDLKCALKSKIFGDGKLKARFLQYACLFGKNGWFTVDHGKSVTEDSETIQGQNNQLALIHQEHHEIFIVSIPMEARP